MALRARLRGGFVALVIPNTAAPGDALRFAAKAIGPCTTRRMHARDDLAIGGRSVLH